MTTDGSVVKTTTVFTPFVTQVCKGIATLMLLTHHLFYNPNPTLYTEPFHEFALNCKACVALFLMLSGCGITLSGCSWRKTYIYRIPHLLLNYWIVGLIFVSIGIFFYGMTFEAAYPKGTEWTFWLQLFGVNWITSCGGFNPTWWFMDAIIPLYCVSPVFLLLLKCNPISVIFLASVAAMFPWEFHWWLTPFAFGMAMVYTNSFEYIAEKKYAAIWLVACSALLVVVYWNCTDIAQHFMIAFFLISIVCSLCVIGGRVSDIIFSPLAFIGRHSMNIFLLHTFLLIWYNRFFTTTKPVMTYPILLGAALLCSIIVEKTKKIIRFNALIAFLKGVAT